MRATTECAAYCRFCYRRTLMQVCAALRAMGGLREILVSGGDPLTASDTRVTHLLSALRSAVPAATLRICTRTPIVLPDPPNSSRGLKMHWARSSRPGFLWRL
ncbi:MAG: hypothetical protein E4H20_01350 [Spirochaetales bacterium]|nr:MAG: hypothetical protein E4H20_01350 [Spirochaetales bacterium]